ncbi:MAG: NUDIX hydrolase [bacterium]|jgi:ADP-ribose pyrophosphatase YjhB (NUDIX family)
MAKRRNIDNRSEENFCMRCGARLVRVRMEGRLRPVCRRCGWIHFKNPASASAVVIISEGRVVLVKRKVPPHVGSWCLPAGFQEYDEGPEETAVREVKEETNLDVQIQKLHKIFFSTAHPDTHAVVHVYFGEKVGGQMRPGDDVSSVRMFPLDKLPSRVAFKSHLEVIEQFKEKRRRRTKPRKGMQRRKPSTPNRGSIKPRMNTDTHG